MRLLIVQYGGDYRQAFRNLAESGVETYHAQKYAIESIAKIGQQIEEAAFLCCKTKERYDEVLPNGLRAIGAGVDPYQQTEQLLGVIAAQKPTHLVVHAPIMNVFRWAIQNQVRTIGLLADSFSTQGLRRKIQNYSSARLLNNKGIDWIANHGVNACLSLQKIGVNPDKIIPWDWPHSVTPESFSPKKLSNVEIKNLVYVGAVAESKGVGEILGAVAKLQAKGLSVNLKIAGTGQIEHFTQQAKALGIENHVQFLGLVPHKTVIHLMREADLVVVPSRHDYPEGFPLTIYEAFCSRTPLVASDHPMFENNLKHETNAMIFPAGDATALAGCVEKLFSDAELYHSLSNASFDAWKRLQIPVKWAELIDRWLQSSTQDQQWLFDHRLTSGRYDQASKV